MWISVPARPGERFSVTPALEDSVRGFYLQSLGFTSRGAAQGFLLIFDGKRIPIQTNQYVDETIDGQLCRLRRRVLIGESAMTAASYDVPEYKFSSDAEREQVARVAIEALLRFRIDTDGLDAATGKYRVEYGDRLFSTADFS